MADLSNDDPVQCANLTLGSRGCLAVVSVMSSNKSSNPPCGFRTYNISGSWVSHEDLDKFEPQNEYTNQAKHQRQQNVLSVESFASFAGSLSDMTQPAGPFLLSPGRMPFFAVAGVACFPGRSNIGLLEISDSGTLA